MEPRAATQDSEDRLSLRVRQVCDAVGQFIEYWGFKAIHGRIWTFLTLRNEPVSQIEIADFFGVSRSLVSGAMAELIDRGLVRAVSDHRNAPYEAVIDFWPSISDVLRDREWMLVEGARLALEGAIEEMELAHPRSSARFSLDRMRLLLRAAELAQALLRVLIGIRVPRKLEELGSWLKSSSKFIRSLRLLR